jgi:hypothetical protein
MNIACPSDKTFVAKATDEMMKQREVSFCRTFDCYVYVLDILRFPNGDESCFIGYNSICENFEG